jgi:proteasome lid subunit RPN8/RPN11
MQIPVEVVLEIQNIAKLNPKKEMCGLISSDFKIHPVPNVSSKPESCFVFSKREYFTMLNKLASDGLTIAAVYHTHPRGDATPSAADLNYIRLSKRNALIVSKNNYRWIEYA